MLLGIVAALAVAAVILLLQKLTAKDRLVADRNEELKELRSERDEARREAREATKQAGVSEGDLKDLRKDLKAVKKDAYKAKEKLKTAQGRVARREEWSASKEAKLQTARREAEAARTEAARLRDDLDAAGRAASSSRSLPEVVVSDDQRVTKLTSQVTRMSEDLERARVELNEFRGASRQRDRDLISARKLAVQHERAFQVVRGQLDIARERLAAVGESLGDSGKDGDGARAAAQSEPEPETETETETESESETESAEAPA